MAERLYRSQEDKVLAGVAGGLARHLDADPSIVRVIWAVSVVVTGGIALLVYIVMAIVVPYPPKGWVADAAAPTATRGDGGGRSAGLVVGLILVVVGVIFLIRELLPQIDLSLSWPILSVVVGAALIVLSIRPSRSSG